MKKIQVRSDALHLHTHATEGHVEVGVYDSIDDPVAEVTVYPDGSAELKWRDSGDTYRRRDESWWNDLCTEVAKAVAAR